MITMLPLIDRPVDATALAEYMTCPRAYYYSMVEHRRGEGRKPALTFGAAWHKAMELHYRTDGDESAVFTGVALAWEDHEAAGDYRSLERVLIDYRKYLAFYGKPSKEEGKTIGWPEQPLLEITAELSGGGLINPYTGKLDRLFEMDGLVYVEDHKTTSRLDKYYFMQFDLSQQMMGYALLAKLLLPDRIVAGVRINVSHVLTSKTEFHRQLLTFSPDRIREFVHNTNVQTARLQRDYATLSGEREVAVDMFHGDGVSYAFPGHYGDNGCSRKFGACAFTGVCSSAPRARRHILNTEFQVNRWNPLEADL